MKRIVPAILTSDKSTFQNMLELTSRFCDYVQVDIMDGRFVPSQSITPEDIAGCRSLVFTEAHLMVEDPLKWIEPVKKFGAKAIIFHVEIIKDIDKIISVIKEQGMLAGLAINPDTPISKLDEFIDKIDLALFMSVVPGFYGSEFIPSVLGKIKSFREKFPKPIGIDGGVKISNLKEVALSGADNICVGSAVLKAENPALAYRELSQLLQSIEN